MSNHGLPVGNRNMTIRAPEIGPGELRTDLELFEAPVVLSNPSYDNPHHALLDRATAWFDRDMDAYEVAQFAQLVSGCRLAGFALQRLAGQAEEAEQQYKATHNQSRFYRTGEGEQ